MNFTHCQPTNLVFGRGTLQQLGTLAAPFGSRALLVTGKSSEKTGLLHNAVSLLQSAGISVSVFDDTVQNPTTKVVDLGCERAKADYCDMVIGLGGGSPLDAAKAIAFMVKNDGLLFDYIYGKKTAGGALPIIAVPTTCGTGSEGNSFAVITNPETGDKKSLRVMSLIPKISIVDSSLMETMPKRTLACVGFDALCHNIEAYIARNTNPIVKAQTMYGMELIAKYLVKLCQGEGTPEAWDAVTLASTLGGMNIGVAGVCACHGMEHPVSGLRDAVHGEGLAALICKITQLSSGAAVSEYRYISQLFGGKDETDCHFVIKEYLKKLNMDIRLSQLGICEKDIDWLTENCLKVSGPSIQNSPRVFSKEEIGEIYHMCL